ncbi:hypothetical protein [Neobacillus niacini]|uniref:hypothetical protein n=1 Tax=Neobacillus niacini TaxID=86668 RepID=UPI0021CB3069|nr:hypothetical protein [Neobacillus niacini]MCM3766077.1 hypothetical protein [Neobacillus niacini]
MKKMRQKANRSQYTDATQPDANYDRERNQPEIVPHQPLIRKSLGWASLFVLGLALLGSVFTTSFSDEGIAEEVVANRISTISGVKDHGGGISYAVMKRPILMLYQKDNPIRIPSCRDPS